MEVNQLSIIDDLVSQISLTDRYKLYIINSNHSNHYHHCKFLNSIGIQTIDIGYELSQKINPVKSDKYINIVAQEYIQNIIVSKANFIDMLKIKTVAIFNLGILFEPDLGLNPANILKELSKTTAIILIWENSIDSLGNLYWNNSNSQIGFDFKDINCKEITLKIQNEI